MCGRFTQAMTLEKLVERFDLPAGFHPDLIPRYNLAPTQTAVVLRGSPGGSPDPVIMLWGLVPPWAKDNKYQPIVNLRAETVLNRPAFNRFLKQSRCIVPADGFFEWRAEKMAGGKNRKVPFRYQPQGEELEGIFGLGGVFNTVTLPNGTERQSFCLITTEPNTLVSQVHNRMPVIIPRKKEKRWLDPQTKQMDYVECLAPYPAKDMVAYEVSSVVNSAKNDSPECIAPAIIHRTCK